MSDQDAGIVSEEVMEQARLLGMSAERELALRAKNRELERALEFIQSSPHCTSLEDARGRAIVALCNNRAAHSKEHEEARDRVIAHADEHKEFVLDVDGYYYWWPEGSNAGHLASHHLRWLADELDKRNEKWNKTVNEYFDQQQENKND